MNTVSLFDNVVVKDHVALCMLAHRDKLIADRNAFLASEHAAILAETPLPQGYVTVVVYDENGVPIHRREGHNIWTLTGREYLALLMSYANDDKDKFRDDRICYIGFGEGAFPESYSVARLHTPLQFSSETFLTEFIRPPVFPLAPARTVVRYEKVIGEESITFDDNPGHEEEAFISEVGMFTDGSDYDIGAYRMWDPGSREITTAAASKQRPVAYKSFDPIPKKKTYSVYLMWEVRF
jgi:hypothetical protein